MAPTRERAHNTKRKQSSGSKAVVRKTPSSSSTSLKAPPPPSGESGAGTMTGAGSNKVPRSSSTATARTKPSPGANAATTTCGSASAGTSTPATTDREAFNWTWTCKTCGTILPPTPVSYIEEVERNKRPRRGNVSAPTHTNRVSAPTQRHAVCCKRVTAFAVEAVISSRTQEILEVERWIPGAGMQNLGRPRPCVLFLGMAYPDVLETIRSSGVSDPEEVLRSVKNSMTTGIPDLWVEILDSRSASSSSSPPSVPASSSSFPRPIEMPEHFLAAQLTHGKMLTEIDGRDLARIMSTESVCGVNVFTVSKGQGAKYRHDRHLSANFNNSRDLTRSMETFWSFLPGQVGKIQFKQIVLDYYWMPSLWTQEHWTESFFNTTLVDFAKKGHLEKHGKVYIPFTLHCFKQVMKYCPVLVKYFDISFLRKHELGEITLWKGTQEIDEEICKRVFKKKRNQEEVYCTFDGKSIAQGSDDPLITADDLFRLACRIEDFWDVRFIVLQALAPGQTNSKGKGKIVGLAEKESDVENGLRKMPQPAKKKSRKDNAAMVPKVAEEAKEVEETASTGTADANAEVAYHHLSESDRVLDVPSSRKEAEAAKAKKVSRPKGNLKNDSDYEYDTKIVRNVPRKYKKPCCKTSTETERGTDNILNLLKLHCQKKRDENPERKISRPDDEEQSQDSYFRFKDAWTEAQRPKPSQSSRKRRKPT